MPAMAPAESGLVEGEPDGLGIALVGVLGATDAFLVIRTLRSPFPNPDTGTVLVAPPCGEPPMTESISGGTTYVVMLVA